MGRGILWERSDREYLRLGGQNPMTGPLRLAGDPAEPGEATSKAYVDRVFARAPTDADIAAAILVLTISGGLIDARIMAAMAFSTFPDGDATPSIAGRTHFRTANTAPTIITDFLDPQLVGHDILIDFGDANTTIQASARIRLQGGVLSPQNDFGPSQDGVSLTLYFNGTQFREKSRSVNVIV